MLENHEIIKWWPIICKWKFLFSEIIMYFPRNNKMRGELLLIITLDSQKFDFFKSLKRDETIIQKTTPTPCV